MLDGFWTDFGGPNRSCTCLYASRDFSYIFKSVVVARRGKKQKLQAAQKQMEKQIPPAICSFFATAKGKQARTEADTNGRKETLEIEAQKGPTCLKTQQETA